VTGVRRSRRTIAKLGIGGVIGACLVATLGAPAFAAAGGTTTFSVRPANPDPNDPLTRAYFRPVLTPGATGDEAVTVDNTGAQPVELYVYPVDGLTGTTSGTVYGNRTDPLIRAGAWLTAGTKSVTIGAHQEQVVPFRITVPADASPGDHVAGIAFEDAHPTRSPGFSVTEVIREVVGVQIRVPGPGQFHLLIGGVSLAGALPAESVVIQLGDDGDRLGQPLLVIKLSGPGGHSHKINRQLDTPLPGDTIAYPVPWPEALAAGTYTVSIIGSGAQPVSYAGTVQLTTASRASVPTTTPQSGSPRATAPAEGTTAPGHHAHHAGAAVWIAGLAALLVLAAAFGWLMLGRRRRGEPSGAPAEPAPAAVAETAAPPAPSAAPTALHGAPATRAGPQSPPEPAVPPATTWQKSAIGASWADHPARR